MTLTRTNRTKIIRLASILFAATMVFAVAANAESGNTQHRGSLNIKAETVVQGTTLPPGEYEVRQIHTGQGDVVEFVRKYWNEAASEMVQAEEDQVISRVPVTEQPLNERPAHTKLELSADGKAVTALQIRHVPVDYIFEQASTQARNVASSNCVGAMQ